MNILRRIPVKTKQVVYRTVNDQALLVLPSLGKVKVLNETGAVVWEFIDGKSSISDIISNLIDEYEIEPDILEKDIISFLNELGEKRIIDFI